MENEEIIVLADAEDSPIGPAINCCFFIYPIYKS